MSPSREPPTAARIAEIRSRDVAWEVAGRSVARTEIHYERADLLAALDYCRETLHYIAYDAAFQSSMEMRSRRCYDRLFREDA